MKRLLCPLLGLDLHCPGLAVSWIVDTSRWYRLRNTRWQPPTPITADYKQMLPLLHEPAPTFQPVSGFAGVTAIFIEILTTAAASATAQPVARPDTLGTAW